MHQSQIVPRRRPLHVFCKSHLFIFGTTTNCVSGLCFRNSRTIWNRNKKKKLSSISRNYGCHFPFWGFLNKAWNPFMIYMWLQFIQPHIHVPILAREKNVDLLLWRLRFENNYERKVVSNVSKTVLSWDGTGKVTDRNNNPKTRTGTRLQVTIKCNNHKLQTILRQISTVD